METKRMKKYAEFCKVMDEVLSEPDDMTEFNEIDDDTIPDFSGFTSYAENKYGYEDGFSGDISKSSRTETVKDILG